MASKKTVPAVVTVVQEQRDVSGLIARIDALIIKDASIDTETHRAAMDCLAHAADTGDYTLIARLLGDVKTKGGEEFGKGVRSRRLALIEWMTAFSPIRISGDGVIGMLKEGAKTYKPFNLEGAEACPFYAMPEEVKRRTANKPFDVAVMHGRIFSLSKAIDTAAEKGTLNDEEAALRELASHVQAAFTAKAKELGLDVQAAKDRRQAA